MDEKRFDAVVREIGATRRVALGMLAGGLGVLVAAKPERADAKKRKKKAKDRCLLSYRACPINEFDCCGRQCCLEFLQPEGGRRYCASSAVTCCTGEDGGGECPAEYPVCCPKGSRYACATQLGLCNTEGLNEE